MLDRVFTDWPLKTLSLAIAVALWVTITGEDTAVKDFDIPLEIQLRDEHILASSPPTEVTVRLEGPRTVVRKLDPVELTLRIDLRKAARGARDVQLSVDHLAGLPRRIDVASFEPDRVNLVIDRRMRRELPVVADLQGEPPEGYTVYRTRVRPDRIRVEGPEAAVRTLTQLSTDTLSLENRTRTFTENVGALPERPEVRIVDPQPIEIRVVIDTDPVQKTFEEIAVEMSDIGVAGTFAPAVVSVVLNGPIELLDRLAPEQILVVADLSGLESDAVEGSVPVEGRVVDLPEEQLWRVEVKSVRPATVGVNLESEE
jgi:YbbR domain-containing protein